MKKPDNKNAQMACLVVLLFGFLSFAKTPLIADSFESHTSESTVFTQIKGNFRFDNTLTVSHQLDKQVGISAIHYQWFADNVALSGETQTTLEIGKSYIGKRIHVEISYVENGNTKKIIARAPQKIEGYTQYPNVLNDTGITFGDSYPTGNNSDCTGVTISAQDCSHGLDAKGIGFRFVKISEKGTETSNTENDWACVKDERTGLIWEKKTNSGLHNKDDTYSWYIRNGYLNGGAAGVENASRNVCHGYSSDDDLTYCNTQAFLDRVNEEALCGYSDWRLPYREELRNIADLSVINPSIDTDFFPNTLGEFYWTASPFASSVDYAWIYDFYDGYGNFYPRSNSYRVRLVRGQP